MHLEIDRLTIDDVDDAWQLSTQVGWNQTVTDWMRLLKLFPETCFAGRIDDKLIATSTLATHGNAGWIGMVLVDEAYRQRGYGSALFERALRGAHAQNLEFVGLDATDAGRKVYRQYEFEALVGIDRWSGSLQKSGSSDEDHAIGEIKSLEEADSIVSFDQIHVGADRSALLEHMIADDKTTAFHLDRNGRTQGYAIVRPGRTQKQIGPVVTADSSNASILLSSIADRIDEPIFIDVLRSDQTESLLRRFGLTVQRQLYRMTENGSRTALTGDDVLATAGFEWG